MTQAVTGSLQAIDAATLARLRRDAAASPRKRAHLLLHSDHADPVQRLLIMLDPGSYVRPHRHSEQWEMLTLVGGAGDFLVFSGDGAVRERIRLGADATRLVQIAPGQVHGFVALEPGTLVLEVKPGPYRANEFVDWAPAEGTSEATALLDRLARAQAGEAVASG
jgi:cupin fold WbuC family metalloprotein